MKEYVTVEGDFVALVRVDLPQHVLDHLPAKALMSSPHCVVEVGEDEETVAASVHVVVDALDFTVSHWLQSDLGHVLDEL